MSVREQLGAQHVEMLPCFERCQSLPNNGVELAKVGVEGWNPLARSMSISANHLAENRDENFHLGLRVVHLKP
jgi:hypothetical protein